MTERARKLEPWKVPIAGDEPPPGAELPGRMSPEKAFVEEWLRSSLSGRNDLDDPGYDADYPRGDDGAV